MKNIIKITTLLILTVSLIGCNAVDDSRFKSEPEKGWIEFGSSEILVLNQDFPEFEIPVEYNVPVNRQNVTYEYTVEVVSGTNPGVETGTFTQVVPADTRDASFMYDLLASETGSYTVKFTITNIDNPDVIIGLEGDNPIVLDLTVVSSFTGVASFSGAENNTFVTTLVPTDEPNQFTISSAWGDNFVAEATGDPSFEGLFVYPGVLTINDDNTIVITSDDPALPGTVTQDDSTNGNEFDPETLEFVYTLDQNLFNGDFVVDVVLTPAP